MHSTFTGEKLVVGFNKRLFPPYGKVNGKLMLVIEFYDFTNFFLLREKF